jgi:hypothetical protein
MVFDIAEQHEGEDYYEITLSFRPEGDFDGTPGREEFFIEKEGPVAYRQVRSLPKEAGDWQFPVVPVAVGLVIVAIVAVVAGVLAISGGDNGNGPPPTTEPAPIATVAGGGLVTPPPTTEIIPEPTGNTLSIDGAPVGPGQAAIGVANGVIFLSDPPGNDGTYADDFELTLEASPDVDGSEIVWSGVDFQSGSVAGVTMDADRSVKVEIMPPPPTPERLIDDHADNPEEATFISPGSTFGTIDPPYDVDFFTFFALAGVPYTVEVHLNPYFPVRITMGCGK